MIRDLVTRQMIPDSELFDKPIRLRNACIFYLGHIPTFFDMKLTEATDGKPTEPKYFYKIFERGIDPDVNNPEKVHAHSEVPDTWPALDEILEFQRRVRERVAKLFKSGQAYNDQWTSRALWLGFEHEVSSVLVHESAYATTKCHANEMTCAGPLFGLPTWTRDRLL